MTQTDRYQQNDAVLTRDIMGETMLIPLRDQVADLQQVYSLNETAAAAWQQLASGATAAELADTLAATFEITTDAAEADITELLAELLDRKLILKV